MSEANFTPTEPILVDTPSDTGPDATAPEAEAAPPKLTPRPDPVAPTAAPATPTAYVGMSVDERAYQQYQTLAKTVLDSADIASKSAAAAAAASSDMHKTTQEFKTLTEVGHKKAILLLGATGGVLLICLIFFLVMGVRMNSRINQLDTMMLAVGKRVVDLNVGLESLDVINRSIEGLSALQTEQAKTQGLIEGRINEALKKSESLVQTVPGETAKQVAASSDNLLKQVQGINSRLQTQAGAVQTLSGEVKALKGAVGNVDKLNRDVEALVTLQKERYLETLQKNSATTNRERAVQFPRTNPPGASTNAPGPSMSAPSSKPAAEPGATNTPTAPLPAAR
jgi:methyl-accepting chemotaxis protein